MAEGVNTPQSAEKKEEAENGQIPSENGESVEVGVQQLTNGAGPNDPPQQQEGPEREITQTDHINKSLLTSFLSRLNDPANSSQFPSTQVIDTEPDEYQN